MFTLQLLGDREKPLLYPRWASQGEVNAGSLPVGFERPDGTQNLVRKLVRTESAISRPI